MQFSSLVNSTLSGIPNMGSNVGNKHLSKPALRELSNAVFGEDRGKISRDSHIELLFHTTIDPDFSKRHGSREYPLFDNPDLSKIAEMIAKLGDVISEGLGILSDEELADGARSGLFVDNLRIAYENALKPGGSGVGSWWTEQLESLKKGEAKGS